MFNKIKDALFPSSPTSEEQKKIQAEREKIAEQLGGPFNAFNNAHRWFGYTFDEAHNCSFGYYHWQGQYFQWRDEAYDGMAASLVLMGNGFSVHYHKMKEATTEDPTPEETAFLTTTKTLWDQVRPVFSSMDDQQAIELFFSHCLGPATPLRHQENYNYSCPFEITYLFHTNRTRCSSVEEARRLDEAYYAVFRATMMKKKESDFTPYLDHPYSPVLDGTLKAPIPLPGVEEDMPLPAKAITRSKIVLVFLNDILAEEFASIRDHLGMTGTRLSDYKGTTAANAVKDSVSYDLFADRVLDNMGSVDWALFYMPMMLKNIKEIFEEKTNYYLQKGEGKYNQDDKAYELSWPFENVPAKFKGTNINPEEMETHSDWLQERRDEMAWIFAQFSHITGVKPAAPVEALSKPVRAEAPLEDVIEAPTLSDEPISLEMTIDEARVFLKFRDTEKVTLEALYTRYKDATAANDSKTIQEEIDTAYQVLIAHLKNQSKEMTEEKARKFYSYGTDEIIKEFDLLDRYTNIIKNKELGHLYDEAKKAYLVLLEIAA